MKFMICKINGQEISAWMFMCCSMNFGQPVSNLLALPYYVDLDKELFIKLISELYEKFVQEEQEDILIREKHGEIEEWPELTRLKEIGYPSLEILIEKEPHLLEEIVKEHIYIETLDRLFPYSHLGQEKYSINTLDKVNVHTDHLILEGQAYPL